MLLIRHLRTKQGLINPLGISHIQHPLLHQLSAGFFVFKSCSHLVSQPLLCCLIQRIAHHIGHKPVAGRAGAPVGST